MNRVLCCVLLTALVFAQEPPRSSSQSNQVPVMNGGAGPCSVELTISDNDAKPVYAATVRVHVTYGFGGIRKLDLEAGTNADGKLKFTGLPARVHRPPLAFHISKGDLTGLATVDPATECEAKRGITVSKKPADDEQ